MLANVQQKTIRPIIAATVTAGALIHTDEYDIYARLESWGYRHQTVCHARGEYARDEDGDGFCEVHGPFPTVVSPAATLGSGVGRERH